MRINIAPDSSYLFRPCNLRELADTLEDVLAENEDFHSERDSAHQQRLYKALDMIRALLQAAKEAAS